jgi:predicted Zn-dependent protease
VRVLLLTGLAIALLLALAGCGGPQLISMDDEIRMGRQAGAEFEQTSGGLDRDPRRTQLATDIGGRISRVAARPPNADYPYEFRGLANDQVNANAFPGGLIYLWRGLYQQLSYDPDQLAWVASHEAAHVARQHSVRRIERSLGYELVIELLLGKDSQRQIAGAIAGLTLQGYSRDQEYEADRVGLEFAHDAGYDPTASLAVIGAFKKVQGKDPSQLELLFETHPGNADRENALKSHLQRKGWSGRYYKPTG